MNTIWHDLECGSYAEDQALWHELAALHGGPILDVGAGTGRVALALARTGRPVVALDHDEQLLEELQVRAHDLPVRTVRADARSFNLPERFPLILVPMQTIQLLGGVGGRAGFLASAQRHLSSGGRLAIAIADALEPFEPEPNLLPLPDICEREGTVYYSQPTAVRPAAGGHELHRRREVVLADGAHTSATNVIHLDEVTADGLEREARGAGLTGLGVRVIPASQGYAQSTVVMLGA